MAACSSPPSCRSPLPIVEILDDPAPGHGFFYMSRADSDVGHGFYDTIGRSQIDPRDMFVNASPQSCQAATAEQPGFFRILGD